MESLQQLIVDVMNQCIENGMRPPFIVCAVSSNGSVLATRISEWREPDTLAQHFEDNAFVTPINIMVVDSSGEAVPVVIRGGGVRYQ
jgi:hypothetical protein